MATARCIAQTLCQRWYIVLPIMTGCIVTLFAADRKRIFWPDKSGFLTSTKALDEARARPRVELPHDV